jgi:hypothetical protein
MSEMAKTIPYFDLSVEVNFTTRDLYSARPFVAVERHPDDVFACSKIDVGRRVTEEFAINVDFTAIGNGGDMNLGRCAGNRGGFVLG